MKKILVFLFLLSLSSAVIAQGVADKPEILYGSIRKEQLLTSPSDKWFVPNYNGYQPDSGAISSLKKLNLKGISVQIYLGTWCGDSKREVPRFLKLMDQMAFSQKQIQMIALGGSDSLYKQSPQHEEAGKGIFRVPVFIIYRDGVEINRINEFPVSSLEKDILAILSHQSYTPNYKSFKTAMSWLEDGTLLDKNSSSRGLAGQLRSLVSGEYELNSLGYLLVRQGRKEEALKIFQVNAALYPESANVISSLGEGYLKTGDIQNAIQWLERSLELNKDPLKVKEILKLLYEAKGLKG